VRSRRDVHPRVRLGGGRGLVHFVGAVEGAWRHEGVGGGGLVGPAWGGSFLEA
jgi:hypothetical protein